MVRFLQDRIHLQSTPSSASATAQNVNLEVAAPQAEAEAAPSYSTMGISFIDSFITKQEQELQRMMHNFNHEKDEVKRHRLFAKIVGVFQEEEWMPHGFYLRVCEILSVPVRTIANWLSKYKTRQRSAAQQAGDAHAPALMPQGAESSTTPSLTLAAVASPSPLTFPVPAATTSAAPSIVQAPASPVFAASTAPSTSAAVQLAPVLPPFTAGASPQSLGMTALDGDDDVQVAPISPVFPGPFSPPAIDTSAYSTAQLAPTLQPVTPAAPSP
ncbi:MAG: hypothetical protein ACRC7P_06240, partial [Enterovibrio sp.]